MDMNIKLLASGEILMKKVLILEDDENTRNALVKTVKSVDDKSNVFAVASDEEAYVIVMKHTIDLFILDIILKPGGKYRDSSGAEFAQNIRMIDKYMFTPIIILTSLYDSKLNMYSSIQCYKYIEKPCDYEKVREVIKKAIKYHTNDSKDKLIFYRYQGILETIEIKEIIFVMKCNSNIRVVTSKDEVTIPHSSLKNIKQSLDSEFFVQCSRNTIVNLCFVKRIDPINRYIYLNDSDEILEIGTVLRKAFLEAVKTFGISLEKKT